MEGEGGEGSVGEMAGRIGDRGSAFCARAIPSASGSLTDRKSLDSDKNEGEQAKGGKGGLLAC